MIHLGKEKTTPKMEMPLFNVSTMTGSLFMNIITSPEVPVNKSKIKTLKGAYYEPEYEIDFVNSIDLIFKVTTYEKRTPNELAAVRRSKEL